RRPTEAFLSERVRAIQPSGIRRFFDMLAEMRDVISLTIGEPDFTTPEPITRAAIDSLEHGQTHYTANGGIVELRQLIAKNLNDRYGVAYDPIHELIITVGASEAVDASLRASLDPGDEVIYHEPCFVAYAPCIELAGGVPVRIATGDDHDFEVSAAQIEAAITPRTKAIFLGYPNNPTGAVLDREELAAIAAVAERHDLLVLTDEIYDRLVYGGHQHVAFSALDGMRDRTVLIGGFSKAYARSGWRSSRAWLLGHRAPAMCGCATQPPTRRSSRPWTAWSDSWPAAAPDRTARADPMVTSCHASGSKSRSCDAT